MVRNAFEARIARQLKRAKVKFQYEGKRIPYYLAGHYYPDFIVDTPTGVVYIETKGYFRPEAKRKMVAVKKQNPAMDIRIVFYKEDKKSAKWAEKYGFRYAFEKVPKEWLEGL